MAHFEYGGRDPDIQPQINANERGSEKEVLE